MIEPANRMLDDIDLIARGHVPGGAARAHAAPVRDLDLSGAPASGWGGLACAQVARLVPGESIVIVTDAPPYAMLDAVYAVTGDSVMVEYLATGPVAWVSALTRID